MSFERKIKIGVDSSQAESGVDKMAQKVGSSFGKMGESASKAGKKIGESLDKAASKMEELDKDTASLFKDMVKDAEKYGKTTKDRSAYLEKEIRLLERLTREEKQREKIAAKMKYESKTQGLTGSYSDNLKQQAAHKDYMKQVSEIESRSQMADLQHKILQGKKEDYEQEQREKDRGDDGGDSGRGAAGQYVYGKGQQAVGVGRSALNAAASTLGFGAMLSVAGFIGKTIDEAMQQEVAFSRTGAMGVKTGGVAGLKSADAANYSKAVALEAGYGNVSELVRGQGRIERGSGMELGTMNAFHKAFRAEKEEGKTLIDATEEMVSLLSTQTKYFGEQGKDFTMMHELLERQNSLNEMQLSQSEEMSSKTSIQLMAAFGKIGGSFGDQRQTATLGNINQAITDPNNDFKRAFIMRSIKKRRPGASLLDVSLAQEEGIFGEGVFSGLMEDLTKTFSGDMLTTSISKLFNLKLSQAQALQKSYEADPSRFAGITDMKDIEKTVTEEKIGARGGVGRVEQWQATFNDWAASVGEKEIDYVESLKAAYEEGGAGGLASKILGDIGTAIKNAFVEGGKLLYNAFTGEKEAEDKMKAQEEAQLSYEEKQSEKDKLVKAMAKEMGVDENDPVAMKIIKSKAYKLTHDESRRYLGEVGLVGNDVYGYGTDISKNYTSEEYLKGEFKTGSIKGFLQKEESDKEALKRQIEETKKLINEIGWEKYKNVDVKNLSGEEQKEYQAKARLLKYQLEGGDAYGDLKKVQSGADFFMSENEKDRVTDVLKTIEKNTQKTESKENYSTYSDN